MKALSKGQKTDCGITTLVSGTIGDIERCFDRKGYSPSIDKFYINNIQLLMLIENILLRNNNQYVALSIAAEVMALKEGGRKAKQLKQRFGWIRGEKHLDRLINAGKQGQFPVWKARVNGDWYSTWKGAVYSTSLVLVEDINRTFNTKLELDNQSLTRESLNQAINCWETLGLDGDFKFPPRAQWGAQRIYKYIVEQVDSNYDFSEFSMDDGIGIANMGNFRRNYLQPATKVLRAAAKKYKNTSKK